MERHSLIKALYDSSASGALSGRGSVSEAVRIDSTCRFVVRLQLVFVRDVAPAYCKSRKDIGWVGNSANCFLTVFYRLFLFSFFFSFFGFFALCFLNISVEFCLGFDPHKIPHTRELHCTEQVKIRCCWWIFQETKTGKNTPSLCFLPLGAHLNPCMCFFHCFRSVMGQN